MGVILKLLSGVPLWLYAAVGLFTWGAYGHYEAKQYAIAKRDADKAAIIKKAELEAAKQSAVQKVNDEYSKRLQVANSNAAVLRTANNKLQYLLHQAGNPTKDTAAICGVDGERGKRLESLLAECSDISTEGAARVGKLTEKVTSLQAYVNTVCIGNKNADH